MTTINENANVVIPAQLENALGFNIARVAALFKKELLSALEEFEMTAEQWQVMGALWWSDRELSQVEIGYLTMKDKPTVSRMIDVMEKREWIKRVTNKSDSRISSIVLTKKGLELKSKAPKKLVQHFTPFMKQLTEKEHDDLVALTKKMRHIFNDGGKA